MAEEINVVEEEVAEKELNPFLEATRKVLLASVGVVALAQDEAESFVNKLVERGELAEKDGRQLIKDFMERRKQAAEEVEEEVDLDVRIERILHRLNVPTKNDIDALSRQITALTQKVDELKQS
ncbi:MAG: phasin family protein [Anaerolineae bacterium]|nr:phasin family protein [Anaerolineae bacterium]